MNRIKSLSGLVLLITILSTSVAIVFAGTGSLRIEPFWPTSTMSPANFNIWAQTGTANEIHILLVITESCKTGLTSDVEVSWTGAGSPLTIVEGDWIGPLDTGDPDIPPLVTTPGVSYTIASLKSHLGTSEKLFYVFKPILPSGYTLDSTKVPITVTIDSSDTLLLAYILGKQPGSTLFDTHIPPTPGGFVVPEVPLGTLIGLASMFTALMLISRKPSLIIRK